MSMTDSGQNSGKARLLVVIASYGEKNLPFLKRVIQSYREMTFQTDLVVVSNVPKELGNDVKVVVGLPLSNPWSLPFAHKPVFAENLERYDLFIYTEDDIEVTENQIQAFERATAAMAPDEIPGYIRFEVAPNNVKLLTDVHGAFHWKPDSVKRRGNYTIAEFTNEHAGFYIVTQSQLRKAIASGGYLRPPYEGRYGLPETAATDIYTCCGFRKVVCISALDDFLIRHMSNLYVNRHGVSLLMFQEQIQTLLNIRDGVHPASSLDVAEPKVLQRDFSKSFYEQPCEEVLKMIPTGAKSILSVGCGWGAAELEFKQRGAQATAIPLDSVIGEVAARQGIEVIHGSLDEGLKKLGERKFDCVVISNLFHLLPQPELVLDQCARLVSSNGTLVITGPNVDRIPIVFKRLAGLGNFKKLRNFSAGGISSFGVKSAKRQLKRLGFGSIASKWFDRAPLKKHLAVRRILRRFVAWDWVLQARQ